jgi:hypothetical protein
VGERKGRKGREVREISRSPSNDCIKEKSAHFSTILRRSPGLQLQLERLEIDRKREEDQELK